jgi:hypothetical protein
MIYISGSKELFDEDFGLLYMYHFTRSKEIIYNQKYAYCRDRKNQYSKRWIELKIKSGKHVVYIFRYRKFGLTRNF